MAQKRFYVSFVNPADSNRFVDSSDGRFAIDSSDKQSFELCRIMEF